MKIYCDSARPCHCINRDKVCTGFSQMQSKGHRRSVRSWENFFLWVLLLPDQDLNFRERALGERELLIPCPIGCVCRWAHFYNLRPDSSSWCHSTQESVRLQGSSQSCACLYKMDKSPKPNGQSSRDTRKSWASSTELCVGTAVLCEMVWGTSHWSKLET